MLLSADPLRTVVNTEWEHVEGVVIRGTWLPRAVLAGLLDSIAAIYGAPAGRTLSRAEVDATVATFASLRAQGWTLRWNLLSKLHDRLEKSGLPVDEVLFRGVDPASPE